MLKKLIPHLPWDQEFLFGSEGLILLRAVPAYEYKDGVRTSNCCGVRVTGVAPARGYTEFSVVVKDETAISQEDIVLSEHARVGFVGFVAKPYFSKEVGDYRFSCKADGLVFLGDEMTDKEAKKNG